MGRKQRRVCLGLRCLLLVPLLILLLPGPGSSSAPWGTWPWNQNPRGNRNAHQTADTIFTDASFWTGDPALPWAQALAVRRGRVLCLGSAAHVAECAGPDTEFVPLASTFVTPGFIDSHVHFILGGLQMLKLDLRHAHTQEHFVSLVQSALQAAPPGHWLLGSGWSNDRWGGNLPSASWIDSVSPHNPVWLTRVDSHMGLANTLALAISGITSATPDPHGGRIVRDESGAPTGVLIDSAMTLVTTPSSSTSSEDRRAALTRATKAAWARGVTSIVDFGAVLPGDTSMQAWKDLEEVYMWADSKGSLGVRVSVFLPLRTWPSVVALVRERGYQLSEWLRVGGVKAFADGSLGSSSALFHEAYEDDPQNFGLRLAETHELAEAILNADAHGLQVAVHAIGDAAVDEVLTAYEAAISANGPWDRRLRIEHCQHLSAGAPARFGAAGVIASMQPQHLEDDVVTAERKLGQDRARRGSYLFRSLLGNGTRVALGSDWTVAPLDPLGGMRAAITRRATGSLTTWMPEECLTEEAALIGYTAGAAYAAGSEADVGSLEVGKYADFVVLSRSPLERSEEPMSLVATYVGGSAVFRA